MYKIIYSAGTHGNYLSHLFNCYQNKKILPLIFNDNGNSHRQILKINYDLSYDLDYMEKKFYEELDKDDVVYGIVFEGVNEYSYVLRCSIDRGGTLRSNGIELLESDIKKFMEDRVAPFDLAKFSELYNFRLGDNSSIPRGILRNYFIFQLIYYMNSNHWAANEKIKKITANTIKLSEILNYDSLNLRLKNIFNEDLDFEELHKNFLKLNKVLESTKIEETILDAIEKKIDMYIPPLDVLTESSILYRLEKKYFDIPFLISDNFYKNTREFINYIEYFPSYFKKPNNLFKKLYKFY